MMSFIVPPAASTMCLIFVNTSLAWLYIEPSPRTPPLPSAAVMPATIVCLPPMAEHAGVVRRREDPKLITGAGAFVDDLRMPGCLHAAMLRSPHAHARIASIDA